MFGYFAALNRSRWTAPGRVHERGTGAGERLAPPGFRHGHGSDSQFIFSDGPEAESEHCVPVSYMRTQCRLRAAEMSATNPSCRLCLDDRPAARYAPRSKANPPHVISEYSSA